jgi:hypothetical protein
MVLTHAKAHPNSASQTSLPDLGSTTKSRSWVALIAVVMLMLAAFGWGLFGNITVQTTFGAVAEGGGLVYEVVSDVEGAVSSLSATNVIISAGSPLIAVSPLTGDTTPINVTADNDVIVRDWTVVLGSSVSIGESIGQGVVLGVPPKNSGVASDEPILAVTYVAMNDVQTFAKSLNIEVVIAGEKNNVETFNGTYLGVSAFPEAQERIALITGNPTFAASVTEKSDGAPYAVYLGYADEADVARVKSQLVPGSIPLYVTGAPATVILTETQSNPIKYLFGDGS